MILLSDETTASANLTANSVNINYPTTNILDNRLTRQFRTVDAITTAEIVWDAGAAVTVDSIGLNNHNISSGVTTLKIQGNATDAWGAPTIDETLTWSSGIITKQFTGDTLRYWRLQIIDAGNTDTYISLGRVGLYDSFTLPDISPSVGHTRQSNSLKTIAVSGSAYLDKRYFNSIHSVRFPKVSHAEKANIITQFETIDIGVPFFCTFDETELDFDTVYVTFDQDSLSFNLLINSDFYESSFSLREAF